MPSTSLKGSAHFQRTEQTINGLIHEDDKKIGKFNKRTSWAQFSLDDQLDKLMRTVHSRYVYWIRITSLVNKNNLKLNLTFVKKQNKLNLTCVKKIILNLTLDTFGTCSQSCLPDEKTILIHMKYNKTKQKSKVTQEIVIKYINLLQMAVHDLYALVLITILTGWRPLERFYFRTNFLVWTFNVIHPQP